MKPAPTLATLAAVLIAFNAGAQPAQAPRLTEAELAAQRGGILTPNGFEVGFGATVRTFVDGKLALESRLTWTDQGARTERITGDAGGAALGPGFWTGVIAGANGGETRVLHDFNAGRIASVVINTANNRVIRQETDIQLVLPQLPQLQADIAAARMASNLQAALPIVRGP